MTTNDPALRADAEGCRIDDPTLFLLNDNVYSDVEADPVKILERAGLPADDVRVEITRTLQALGIPPQTDTIEKAAETVKKIRYISDNLTQEAAKEAANALLRKKLDSQGGVRVSEDTKQAAKKALIGAIGGKANAGGVNINYDNLDGSYIDIGYNTVPADEIPIDLDIVYEAVVEASTINADLHDADGLNPESLNNASMPVRPEDVPDAVVEAALAALEFAQAPDDTAVAVDTASANTAASGNKAKTAVRMMIALDIPVTARNLKTVFSYHEKIEKLHAFTPEAAAIASGVAPEAAAIVSGSPGKATVDALLAAASYAKSSLSPALDETIFSGLESQIRRAFEKSGLVWDERNREIAGAILRVDGGVNAENVQKIDALLADVDLLLEGNSEEYAAFLYKNNINPGAASISILRDLQRVFERVRHIQDAETRAAVQGHRQLHQMGSYERLSLGADRESIAERKLNTGRENTVGDTDLARLEGKIADLLRNNSIEPVPQAVDAAKALIRAGVEVNAENIARFIAEAEKLEALGAKFTSIAHISDRGNRLKLNGIDELIVNLRESGRLILENSGDSDPRLNRVENLVVLIGQLRVKDFSAIAALMKHDMPITLKNLSAAYASLDKQIDVTIDDSTDADTVNYVEVNNPVVADVIKTTNEGTITSETAVDAVPAYGQTANAEQTPEQPTNTEPAIGQAANSLTDAEVPVNRQTVINLYLANAAVKKVASTVNNEYFSTASTYLYENGVAVERTPLLTLASLLDATIISVGKSQTISAANSTYLDAMRFKKQADNKIRGAFIDNERSPSTSASNKPAQAGRRSDDGAKNGSTSKSEINNRKNENSKLFESHTDREHAARIGDERVYWRGQSAASGRTATSRGASGSAGGETVDAINALSTNGGSQVHGGNQPGRGGTADTASMSHTDDANNILTIAEDGVVGGSVANGHGVEAHTADGNSGASGERATQIGENPASGQLALGHLLSRIFTAVSRIGDIGAGQLAWMTRSGTPLDADSLAAARAAANNSYSFSTGLVDLETYILSKLNAELSDQTNSTGDDGQNGSGSTPADSETVADSNQNGMHYRVGGGGDTINTQLDSNASIGGVTGRSNMHSAAGAGSGAGESARGGGASGAGNGAHSNGTGTGLGAGADTGEYGSIGANGSYGAGSAGINVSAYRQLLRDIAGMRGVLPGADLAALKNGADISDIYNELKARLSEFEGRLGKLAGRLDDAAAKIVSAMKDNIRAQDHMQKGPVCFQIPFMYNQKPSGLTVFVFNRKRGGRAGKADGALSVALNLETRTLGTLDIGMNISDKRVDIDITSQTRNVRNYLEGAAKTLAGRISDAGFTLGEITCSVKIPITDKAATRGKTQMRAQTQAQAQAQVQTQVKVRAKVQAKAVKNRLGVDVKV